LARIFALINIPLYGGIPMDNLTFGVSMVVVGMGGTLLTLWILSLLMLLLKRIFPYQEENEKNISG
jgi:hypothetical protein